MFLTNRHSGYTRHGEQFASGQFLLLASTRTAKFGEKYPHLYGCVRFVRMSQFGHFMMGIARIGGHSVTVSGTYGSDGLTLDLDDMSPDVAAQFTRLSEAETVAFWTGEGGHNSAGTEAPAMRLVGKRLLTTRQSRKGK